MRILAFFTLLCLSAASAAGQEPPRLELAGENKGAWFRLQAADQLVFPLRTSEDLVELLGRLALPSHGLPALGQLAAAGGDEAPWLQAVEEYLRLQLEAEDALTPLGLDDDVPAPSLPGKRLVQLRLCRLPPSIRHKYVKGIEGAAQRLLQTSLENRSIPGLHRLVDEYFCSKAAAQGLTILGDLAFEGGRLEEALAWWSLLAPWPDAAPLLACEELCHPEPTGSLARLHAKQILALTLAGDFAQAGPRLEDYRRRYPSAEGKLAGMNGRYHQILDQVGRQQRQRLGDDPRIMALPAPSSNPVTPRLPSPRLWADGPSWRVPLKAGAAGPAPPEAVVLDDTLLVANSSGLIGYQVRTGQELWAWTFDPPGKKGLDAADARVTFLTSAGSKVLVSQVDAGKKNGRPMAPGRLAALDPTAGPQGPPRLLWQTTPRWSDGAPALLAGPPLATDEGVLVPVATQTGFQTRLAVQALDWQRGKQLWFQELAHVDEPEDQRLPAGAPLRLTQAGNAVIVTARAGCVLALDPATGQRWWARRLPAVRPDQGRAAPAWGTPCLTQGTRIYVAAGDGDVMCLNLFTGGLLWRRAGLDQAQLLAASQGRLLVITPQGLRGLEAATGLDVPGWQQPALGRLASRGRGLVAGPWVLWPTADAANPVRCLSVRDGCQDWAGEEGFRCLDPTSLRRLPAGNIHFAPGGLIVVTAEDLVAFVHKEK